MTLRVFVDSDRASEKVCHALLFSHRQPCIGKGTRLDHRSFGAVYWPEGVPHQLDSKQFSRKMARFTYRDFNLSKCLKNSGVVFTAQKCRIDPGSDKRMKPTMWEQVRATIRRKILP